MPAFVLLLGALFFASPAARGAPPPPAPLESEPAAPDELAPDGLDDEERRSRRNPKAKTRAKKPRAAARSKAPSMPPEGEAEPLTSESMPWGTVGCASAACLLPVVPGAGAGAALGGWSLSGVGWSYSQLATNPSAGCSLGIFSCLLAFAAVPIGVAAIISPLFATIGGLFGSLFSDRPGTPAIVGAIPGIAVGIVGGVLAVASPLIWFLVAVISNSALSGAGTTLSPELSVASFAAAPALLFVVAFIGLTGGPLAVAGGSYMVALEPERKQTRVKKRRKKKTKKKRRPRRRELPPPGMSPAAFAGYAY